MFFDFNNISSERVIFMADVVGQPQTVQVPNYSGVNIQIFNPSVAAPGATVPPANINAQNYSASPIYPANYYTQNLAQSNPVQPVKAADETEKKKTEKRKIIELTDDYIKNLENYLSDQNPQVRLMGAKEVLARLQEDESRKNDEALNALINKMLQDPYQPVKLIALGILETKTATGNNKSIELVRNIQHSKTKHGEDELKASNVLLKMSGPTIEKEFDIKDKPKSKGEKE